MTTSAATTAPQDSIPGATLPGADAAPASRKRFVFIGVGLLIAAAAAAYWQHSRGFEETDDAQIDGTISNISPRITGTVTAVYVKENQLVKEGDVLAEIDPADLRIALMEAQAQLEVEDPNVPITQAANVSALASAQSDVAGAMAALSGARKDVQQLTAQ